MRGGQSVDLTNCDREPIHIPGTIQTHGCLLACDASASTVLRHSVNAQDYLGHGGDVNGRLLEEIIGRELAHDVRNALAMTSDPARSGVLYARALPDGRLTDIAVHRHKGIVIVEFERLGESEAGALEIATGLVERLRRFVTVDELVRHAPRLLRAALGYDRVMVYRFASDGSGQVVGEARRSGLESFMGQHFPASDIPQQARRLYVENTIRVIGDSSGASIPIHPVLDDSGEPLDLSFARLRSVSPIHCEYLRNMGVGASMSISVIVAGHFWGLIACHHYAPRRLSASARAAAELFGSFFSLHLESLLDKERLAAAVLARSVLDELLRDASQCTDLADFLSSRLDAFQRLAHCDGVGIFVGDTWASHGSAPPAEAIPALCRFMTQAAAGGVFATHCLSQRLPEAEAYHREASGVLAIPLSKHPRDFVFLFRKEVLQTLEWAGDPSKQYGTGPHGDRLTPRKSFAIWKDTVEKQSVPWTASEREIAEAARVALVEVVLHNAENLEEERGKAAVRQRMLTQELNHRVKNILSLIKSLVGQPVRAEKTLGHYIAELKGRIQALAHAHDQVVRGSGGGPLSLLLEAELSPYRGGGGRVVLEGPPVELDARAYSVMALVLHELATNAAKYGALSRRGGSLQVRWDTDELGGCRLVWRETGGPPVTPPSRTGFGTVLLDRSIPHDLGGRSDIVYHRDGVQAEIDIPSSHIGISLPAPRPPEPAPVLAVATDDLPLAGLTVLLVEDQLMIALEAETVLFDAGAKAVETCGNVADALKAIDRNVPDIGVLDINLGPELSVPVAQALHQRGIPYAFATGYGETGLLPEHLAGVPVVRKPYEAGSLSIVLGQLLAKARAARSEGASDQREEG